MRNSPPTVISWMATVRETRAKTTFWGSANEKKRTRKKQCFSVTFNTNIFTSTPRQSGAQLEISGLSYSMSLWTIVLFM